MKINCIIIDDEHPAREELVYLLSEYDEIKIMDQADSASKAVTSIQKNRPDFIFLDIQMPGKSGFDVISEIKNMKKPPLVVFTTAYDQYAVKAFEKNAIDYIMKPFSQDRLEKSINRVKEILNLKNENLIQKELKKLIEKTITIKKIKKISVEHKGRLLLLNPDDIVFCRYKDKKISIHTKKNPYTLYGINTLNHLELHLASNLFFRSHRNTIVSFNHIKEFSPWFHGKYHLTMNDGNKTELIVTRDRVKLFKQHLGI
ncbi:LytTR family DNA-binding domain-containing protein [Desulfobacula sp.]|uniref:LytR/AlgR family response regulator transcription factor n=1 Tax=Desulfobacula sp. TaxID=2593537 RepID=UPI0025BD0777|nr:LytTR family DNA-binding domain-containing protein [Desulfobacula sp.]MBC2705395.1 response regulator transcription factor [Desulfobacula sp.]